MLKTIKSHKYLAESILKRFSYKDNANRNIIDYIDTRTMEIKNSSTKRFNRELGYYTNYNELNLKTNSEEKIGNVIRKLEDHRLNNKTDFILSKNDKETLTKYLAYQWLRSDYLNDLIKKRLNIILPLKSIKNILIAEEEYTKLISKQTKDMGICIIFNNTSKQYIINSSNSLFNKDSTNAFIITVVLTPNISIIYCKKDFIKNAFKLNGDIYILAIDDELSIKNQNLRTFYSTLNISPYFVVGRIEELKEVIEEYNKDIKIK